VVDAKSRKSDVLQKQNKTMVLKPYTYNSGKALRIKNERLLLKIRLILF
jgi:hypothetical protein